MSDEPKPVYMPLFHASDLVANAVGSGRHEAVAVLSTDGETFRLHSADAVREGASKPGQRIRDLPGQVVKATLQGPSSLERNMAQASEGSGIEVVFVEQVGGLGPYARISFDRGTLTMVRPRWRCDTHGETYIKADNGVCPRHPGATLVPIS